MKGGAVLGKILRYLKHYKIEAALGPLFKMLEALFELFIPLVVADIILVTEADYDTLSALSTAKRLVFCKPERLAEQRLLHKSEKVGICVVGATLGALVKLDKTLFDQLSLVAHNA